LSPQLAKELAADMELSAFFEDVAKRHDGHSEMASFIVAEMGGESGVPTGRVSPDEFVELIRMVESKAITRAQAKEALREVAHTGKSAKETVKARRLSAISDEDAIAALVEKVVSSKPGMLTQARGDQKVFGYLVGQVLKLEPTAEPRVVAKVLAQRVRKA
jgi:Asp-tRNA(Asn)/Glu-tRNA(Gln) amidotransferase B subunit